MKPVIPYDWQAHIKNPSFKHVLWEPCTIHTARDCKNCGGLGTMVLFLATNGPFHDPPSGTIKSGKYGPDGKEIVISVVAKWYDKRWWAGKHIESECPVCHGTGDDPNYKEPEFTQRELKLDGVVKEKKIEVQEEVDYTDV